MHNRFSYISVLLWKAEIAFSKMLIIACDSVLRENFFNRSRVNPLIMFTANANQGNQRIQQSFNLTGMNLANNQQQVQNNSNQVSNSKQ